MIEYLNFFISVSLFVGFSYVLWRFWGLIKVMEGFADVCGRDSAKRERLIACVNGDGAKQYLRKHYTEEQISALSVDDVEKIHSQYESKLGAAMVMSLGKTIISLYSSVVSNALDLGDSELGDDLGNDPFINAAFQRVTCDLYYKFGSYLVPLSVGVITGKHYLKKSWNDKYGDSDEERENPKRVEQGKKLDEFNGKRKDEILRGVEHIEKREVKYERDNGYLIYLAGGLVVLLCGGAWYFRKSRNVDVTKPVVVQESPQEKSNPVHETDYKNPYVNE